MRGEPLDAEMIVSATEELLRRHGPEKTTVLDVARLLGVSHGSVYRHFPSKAALREAVIRRWLDRVRDDFAAAAQDAELSPPDRLRGLLTTMFAAKWAKAREDPELFATFRVLAAEHSSVSSGHVTFLLTQIRTVVGDGIAGGDFAAGEPEAIARAIFNATSRFHDPTHAAEWHSPETEAESADVISLILDGIRAR
jgi:AcrR family transcriptional regulator